MNVDKSVKISKQIPQHDGECQQKMNSTSKPFLSRFNSKATPIGFDKHQIEVPELVCSGKNLIYRKQQLAKRNDSLKPQPAFLVSKIKQEQLEEYLSFSQKYFQDKISDYFSTAFVSRQRTRAKAIKFLHEMDYNYTKAKFYILFPYYLKYNSYRCNDPLKISDDEMAKKINDHIEGLMNTKEKDMEKWILILEQHLENRVNLHKVNSLIEMGKQHKYQVPENIKQQIDKSIKAGKQIKKFIQGNKQTIEVLNAKKDQLQQNKIVTGEMIQFEDAVTRCEDWIKKQKSFEEKYFQILPKGVYLKPMDQKIQFRTIQLLVSQYNSLPLDYKTFQITTNELYRKTRILLDKIPTFKPVAKTRTARENVVNKISFKAMEEARRQIDKHPVCHEQFSTFQITMRESRELLERIQMYLEDPLSDKSIKVLNNYLKLINDVQIENKLEKRLQMRVEYYEIMERIKKELVYPGKVQSIKQAFNKLKEKGFQKIEDSGYQQKIVLYLGWHESQQKLKQDKIIPTNIQIMKRQLEIMKKMVNIDQFKSQFESAKSQLSIGEEALEENENRLKNYQINKNTVAQILNNEEPNLEEMVQGLKNCIEEGLIFPQFEQLYEQIIKYFLLMIKMHYLLKMKNENLNQINEEFYFTDFECDQIMHIFVNNSQLKDLKTKEGALKVIQEINASPFPKYLSEWRNFEKFMNDGQKWCDETMQLIKEFKEKGTTEINIKQLQQSKYYLHSKALKDEINRIDLILKWRQKISRKLDEEKEKIFSEEDQVFMEDLEKDLIVFENTQLSGDAMEAKMLEFSHEKSEHLKNILQKINNCRIDNFCKLSEMNKFYREIQKQIQRHRFDDKIINEQKDRFRQEIILGDDWKQRYTVIKRFQKKKMRKDDDFNKEEQKEEEFISNKEGLFVAQEENSENTKKKYAIKNGEFVWYFKFFLITLQFYKGYKLKFCLEELQKLKNSLSEIWKFLQHYYKIYEKDQPTDVDVIALEGEGAKIPFFIREYWILKKHCQFIQSWKGIADLVLESTPIIGMELKARKPEELLKVLQTKKIETEQAQKVNVEEKMTDYGNQKRQRKPNKLYNNEDITLLTEENAGPKIKKKRKGNNNDGEYRNTAVASQAKKNAMSSLEEIQRTQALLKGDLAPNLICIEDPKEYCICRYGEPNENTTMLQCEEGDCEEWFHIQCIGIKKHQTKNDLIYTCVGCKSLKGEKALGSFFWDTHQKMTEYAFNEIVEEGENLGVFTNQIKKIKVIKEKMDEWKNSAKDILDKVMIHDLNQKPLKNYEKELYELYLHSLWLPTFHPEGQTIKLLVQICRERS